MKRAPWHIFRVGHRVELGVPYETYTLRSKVTGGLRDPFSLDGQGVNAPDPLLLDDLRQIGWGSPGLQETNDCV